MARAVRKTSVFAVLAVLAAALALPAPGAAGQVVTPTDHCIEIIHFPPEPIGNSPSKGRILSTFPPVFAGGTFIVNLDGASGPVGGQGSIDQLGLGHAEFPLNDFGLHTFTDASIEMAGTSTPVDTTFFGEDGTFTVDANEPVCDPDDLLLAPKVTTTVPPTTVPPTTAPPTTAPPTTAPPTTAPPTTAPPAAAQPSVVSDDGGEFPWWILLVIGILLALGGGAWLVAGRTGGVAKGGTFTDDQGNEWIYCEARGCRVRRQSITDTEGRRVVVRAEPRGGGCADCKCVLFENVGGRPKLLDEDGGWVTKRAGAEYSARCVKKA